MENKIVVNSASISENLIGPDSKENKTINEVKSLEKEINTLENKISELKRPIKEFSNLLESRIYEIVNIAVEVGYVIIPDDYVSNMEKKKYLCKKGMYRTFSKQGVNVSFGVSDYGKVIVNFKFEDIYRAIGDDYDTSLVWSSEEAKEEVSFFKTDLVLDVKDFDKSNEELKVFFESLKIKEEEDKVKQEREAKKKEVELEEQKRIKKMEEDKLRRKRLYEELKKEFKDEETNSDTDEYDDEEIPLEEGELRKPNIYWEEPNPLIDLLENR